MAFIDRLRSEVNAIDPLQANAEWKPMNGVFEDSKGASAFVLGVLLVFAGVALLLATIGVYGMFSYAMEQRGREIAIRLALGAAPRQVLSALLRDSLKLTTVGIAAGLTAAAGLARVLKALLFEVRAVDPATFAVAAAVLAAVTVLASWIPARRAARTDPVAALRGQ
jgi:ABC-type antimicrobial peptide transport system permease subunit